MYEHKVGICRFVLFCFCHSAAIHYLTRLTSNSPLQCYRIDNCQVCRGDRDPHGYGYVVGMGREIPSPRQPWTLPWVWRSPWGSPWVWVCGGYGEGNSVPTAALDSAVGMGSPWGSGSPWVWVCGEYGEGNSVPTAALITAHLRYDTRCCFNVRSKADTNLLNLPLGTKN